MGAATIEVRGGVVVVRAVGGVPAWGAMFSSPLEAAPASCAGAPAADRVHGKLSHAASAKLATASVPKVMIDTKALDVLMETPSCPAMIARAQFAIEG